MQLKLVARHLNTAISVASKLTMQGRSSQRSSKAGQRAPSVHWTQQLKTANLAVN